MKKIKLLFAFVAAFIMGCSGGDDDEPQDKQVTLTTDWTNRGTGIDIPQNYTVRIGTYTATLSGQTNKIDNTFTAGTYRAYVYNQADKVTINETTATVAGATAPTGESGTFVNAQPGWFFSCALDAKIENDKALNLTANMQQQVRQLVLTLEPEGDVESITGVLSGVAGSLNIDNNTHSAPSNVALTFAKGTDGKWEAKAQLLGVTGTEQKLTGVVKYTGGTPSDYSLESNMTQDLSNFNADKKNPLVLAGGVINIPGGVGLTGTISGWTDQSSPINGSIPVEEDN